jgi:nucleotide-binding universal stress UspA family protein
MTTSILCPTDGTEHSAQAVAKAAEIARKYGAPMTLCVVNVAHGGGRGPTISHWTDAEAEAILDAAEAEARAAGATEVHRALVSSREAAAGIVSYAETEGFDHIVMGTGDKRGISRLMLGSVAADVAGRAHCTVTIAR